jgi:HPt (histidine-containing phosphotransfer) domain-containing protein
LACILGRTEAEAKMIDWTHVRALKADMGDAFDEVVEVFLQEVEEALVRLGSVHDAPGQAAEMHFLKGAALNLGFAEFAALCADGETRANAGEAGAVTPEAARALYEVSRGAFLDGLKQQAA